MEAAPPVLLVSDDEHDDEQRAALVRARRARAREIVRAVVRAMFAARGYSNVGGADVGDESTVATANRGAVRCVYATVKGVAALRRMVQRAPAETRRLLVVYAEPLTVPSLDGDMGVTLEVWSEAELLVYSAHIAPPHARATLADVAALRARHGHDVEERLPFILDTDPQARYLALRPGEVVRVTRRDRVRGTYAYFRRCVKTHS